MEAVKITGHEDLVKADIRQKKETYFLVTADTLKSITGKNILTDVFFLIASLLWGAYVSVAIATITSINIPATTKIALETHQKLFLLFAVVISAFAVVFLIITYVSIIRIQKSSLSDTETVTAIEENKE